MRSVMRSFDALARLAGGFQHFCRCACSAIIASGGSWAPRPASVSNSKAPKLGTTLGRNSGAAENASVDDAAGAVGALGAAAVCCAAAAAVGADGAGGCGEAGGGGGGEAAAGGGL